MNIKKCALLSLAALALAGCSSYSEIARWKSDVPVNDGEVPVATFVTQNFSYRLLGLIPLCTGRPWTEGSEDVVDDFNVRFFADEATLDNNLVSLNHALGVVGSRGSHSWSRTRTTARCGASCWSTGTRCARDA